MLTIPVYNPAGERIGEETIDPADFGGEIHGGDGPVPIRRQHHPEHR